MVSGIAGLNKEDREMITDAEEIHIGGRVNRVVLVGQTVRRNAGPWTPTVHRLLTHLNDSGFCGAPRPHGFDESGREVLDFIPGQAGGSPLPDFVLTDSAIKSYGSLLRAYHDATSSFQIPGDAIWLLPAKQPVEVICHGDLSPENCVFQNGLPVSLIDFDVAHPGPRVWDLGYAAFCFVPLQPTASGADTESSIKSQCHRLKLFCDAYGLTGGARLAVVDNAYARLIHLVEQIEEKAAQGVKAFVDSLAAGDTKTFRSLARYIKMNSRAFKDALA